MIDDEIPVIIKVNNGYHIQIGTYNPKTNYVTITNNNINYDGYVHKTKTIICKNCERGEKTDEKCSGS
jgi:hypothetical protein